MNSSTFQYHTDQKRRHPLEAARCASRALALARETCDSKTEAEASGGAVFWGGFSMIF